MVEIRIAVADPAGARGLMRGLANHFDRSSVSFEGSRSEVRVRSEREMSTVMQVIDAVEQWLAADGIASAKLSIGDRSYTLVGPSCPATTHRRAARAASSRAAV